MREQNQSSRGAYNPKPLIGAVFILAGLGALWLAAHNYLDYLGGLDLLNQSRLTPRQAAGLAVLEFILALILIGSLWIIWQPKITSRLTRWIIRLRTRAGWLGYLLAAIIILIPMWFLLHYPVSAAVGYWARLILTIGLGLSVGVLITHDPDRLIRIPELIAAWLIIATLFSVGETFANVTNYPFSMTWSEGNRYWDYSVLFGRRLYNYPAGEPIFAYIDLGRQSLWGLPFLFGRIPIWSMRLWNGLVSTVPYAILGWLAFKRIKLGEENRKANWVWFLCGLWTFLFLNQGPIYTPLVLGAWLVAIAWRRPLWIAIPLVALAGYYVQIARFTWMFAPAIWAGMLFFADQPSQAILTADKKAGQKGSGWKWNWGPSIAVFLAGAVGGFLIPRWIDVNKIASAWVTQLATTSVGGAAGIDVTTPTGLMQFISRQPLIWDRLLPNPTFAPGIILALLIATVPLILLLIYLVITRRWPLDLLRGAAILLPLLAFLGVGLVASVKIGGGGDLHNMDMFLVTLVFVAALAWRAGGYKTLLHIDLQPTWIQILLILMVVIFAQQAISDMTAVRLPSKIRTIEALQFIQREVNNASSQGEVLFLDQRQLLTFGNISSIPLMVDYEKKYLMDQAMSNATDYFTKFNADLAKQRFALIISEPLKVIYHGGEYNFGDENDAWVKWVAQPILCYYEPLKTFKEVKVQILVPRSNRGNCP